MSAAISVNALLVSNGGVYIPMDGPWGSPLDDAAYELANKTFDEMRPRHNYLVLIISHHWATTGYWIETQKKDVLFPDRILKGGDTIPITGTVKKFKKLKK